MKLYRVVLAFAALPLLAEEPPALALKQDFEQQIDQLQHKVVDLAKSVAPERYGWRPAESARSFSEVLLHVASSSFVNAMFLGAGVPPGVELGRDPQRWEKSTKDKARIVELLDLSFEQMRKVVRSRTEAGFASNVKILGQTQPLYRVLMQYSNHLHEHLGQLIAYSRSNDVVPPWSK